MTESATLLAAASVAAGARFTAVDVDPEALRLARQRALLAGIKVAGAGG